MSRGRKQLWKSIAIALTVIGFGLELWAPVLAGAVLYALAIVVWSVVGASARGLLVLSSVVTALLFAGPILHDELTEVMIGEHLTLVVTTWLITALVIGRSRQSARVSEAEGEAQRYLDVAGVVLVALDRDARVTMLNRAGCELLGVEGDEALGVDWIEGFVPAAHRELARDVFSAALRGDESHAAVEAVVETSRGERRRLLWHNTILRDADGRITGTLSSGMDVTELRRAERALELARARLFEQESLARMGEMAAVVAHEVKNPLAGLRSTLQILEKRSAVEPDDRRIIGAMIERIDGLDRMVEEVLAFARPPSTQRQPIDPAVLVRRVLDSAPDGVELRGVEPRRGKCSVEGDAAELERALLNVVLNAVQAAGDPRGVWLELWRDSDTCELRVHDTGPGISEEVRERMFEPFVTTKSRGTGLGLAVTRRIIEGHGGTISLDDRDGGGTVASIRLPLMRAQSSESRSARSTST